MIKVAVVILNWNGKKYLEKFLPTVIKYTHTREDFKVIVADNGSTDESVSFLKKNFPDIQLITFDKNYGFAGGYNKALKQIKAEYYVILNSDVEVSENWIQPIIDLMDKDETIAAVQPKILSFQDKKKFEYAGAAGGYIDKYGYPFCRGRILAEIEQDKGQYDDQKEIFWATGACMFVRSSAFWTVDGFDDDFFAHMEEIDLCWRLKNRDFKILYYPNIKVYHVGGGSLSYKSPYKLYLNYRNNLFLLYKNLKKLFPTLFFRLILDGMSALIYLLKFDFKSFGVVWQAHIHFYKKLKIFRKKREKLLTFNKKNHKEIYQKSIVFDYFVRKKRKFSQLDFNP